MESKIGHKSMYVRDRSILTNIENRLVATKGEGGWE